MEASDSGSKWLTKRRRLDALMRLQAAAQAGEPAMDDAIRVFADALGDDDDEIRALAAAGLCEVGHDAIVALPELLTATGDESAVVRRRAVRTLGEIGAERDEVLTALIASTEDGDPGVALQAIASLGGLGPAAASAVPAMMAMLWTGHVRQRAVAGIALARIGAAAVPALTQALHHPSADVRCKAAQVLARIGPAAASAQPDLERMSHSSDIGVRTAALEALQKINS